MNKEILSAIKERRSIKKYSPVQIHPDELDAVLQAALYAPNGHGYQASLMVVVQDPDTVKQLSRMNAEIMGTDKDPFYGAPTVVVVFADTEVRTWVEDGTLSAGNMLLAAPAVGLGGCWIHRARPMFESPEGKALKQKWGVPECYEGVANIVLGYAAGTPKPQPERKEGRIIMVQ